MQLFEDKFICIIVLCSLFANCSRYYDFFNFCLRIIIILLSNCSHLWSQENWIQNWKKKSQCFFLVLVKPSGFIWQTILAHLFVSQEQYPHSYESYQSHIFIFIQYYKKLIDTTHFQLVTTKFILWYNLANNINLHCLFNLYTHEIVELNNNTIIWKLTSLHF
jgi:hypothetical protein